MLDIEPLATPRRLAARAIRIAERQPHLEGKIGPQEIDEVGTVRPQAGLRIVFVAAKIIEQKIARLVAQHLMPYFPVQVRLWRAIEQLLDPSRKQGFGRAVPTVAHLPDAARRNMEGLRLARGDRNFTADRAAIRRFDVALQHRAPGAGSRRGDLS